jgi:hypothetical protein
MRKTHLPITALEAYAKLNDITFQGVGVLELGAKGYGLAAERPLGSEHLADTTHLLRIPHGLVLCTEAIEEHAKFAQNFHQLLDAAGGKVNPQLSLTTGCSES